MADFCIALGRLIFFSRYIEFCCNCIYDIQNSKIYKFLLKRYNYIQKKI